MSDPYMGEIRMFAGSFAPRGWHDCDGSLLSVHSFPNLFNLLGTKYGGDGTNTFALPDMRSRVPIHQGTGNGLTTRSVGEQLGEENVTIDPAQLAEHTHNWQATSDQASGTTPIDSVVAATTSHYYSNDDTKLVAMNSGSFTDTGGGQAHSNIMPSLAIRFIICVNGLIPQTS